MNTTLAALADAAQTPATVPAADSHPATTVTLSAGVAILVAGVVAAKLGAHKAGWALIAVAAAMLAGTRMGAMVIQLGGQIAASGAQTLNSVIS